MPAQPYTLDIEAVADGVRIKITDTQTGAGMFVVLPQVAAQMAADDLADARATCWPVNAAAL